MMLSLFSVISCCLTYVLFKSVVAYIFHTDLLNIFIYSLNKYLYLFWIISSDSVRLTYLNFIWRKGEGQYKGMNSGSPVCWAGTLPLEPHPCPCFLDRVFVSTWNFYNFLKILFTHHKVHPLKLRQLKPGTGGSHLGTQEAEIKRVAFGRQPEQIVLKTLSRKYPLQKSLAEWLKVKSLSSSPSTAK
jgi:hypothetical protein